MTETQQEEQPQQQDAQPAEMSNESHQDFLRQVSTLRNFLEGQTVLNVGNTWTAEAREPDRKRRLHLQLTLARQLRAKLEQAAEIAEDPATTQAARLEMLERGNEDINTLVSLTQAVKLGHTLDRYDEYSRNLRKQPVKDDVNRDREVIVNQLIAMKEERENPLGVRPAAHPRALEARSSRNAATGSASRKSTKRARSRKPLPASRAASGGGRQESPSSSESSAVARKPSATRQAAAPTYLEQEYYEYHSSDDEEYTPDLMSTSSSARRRSAAKRIKRRSVASRRCHDCKSSTTYFRRCHYWFLTGAKCGKTFCSKCLVFKYGCPSEENWDMNDPDWQ